MCVGKGAVLPFATFALFVIAAHEGKQVGQLHHLGFKVKLFVFEVACATFFNITAAAATGIAATTRYGHQVGTHFYINQLNTWTLIQFLLNGLNFAMPKPLSAK